MVEQEFTKKLFKPSEKDLEIELDETAILKTDKQALANYYSTMIQNGVLCLNEVRKELGYSEIEGGDKHFIPFTKIQDNQINNNNQDGETV
jgi:phage portal protein BeeE